jgi:microsomal dipeptidase-like Zn-dependent dipeptidase
MRTLTNSLKVASTVLLLAVGSYAKGAPDVRLSGVGFVANDLLEPSFAYAGQCPVNIRFLWSVTSNEPTTVSYSTHWMSNDPRVPVSGPPLQMKLVPGTPQKVEFDARIGDASPQFRYATVTAAVDVTLPVRTGFAMRATIRCMPVSPRQRPAMMERAPAPAGGTARANAPIANPQRLEQYQIAPPLTGFVDLHAHPLSNIGFAGHLLFGGIDDNGPMPALTTAQAAGVSGNCPLGYARSPSDSLGVENPIHGGANPGALILNNPLTPNLVNNPNPCGNTIRDIAIHVIQFANNGWDPPDSIYTQSAFPQFPNWPVWNDLTRQRMYYAWIQRAHQYGLNVMVALAVNSVAFSILDQGDTPFDDQTSGDQQIAEIQNLVARHPDFMAVAYSSADLHNIVSQGKLAVIIGVELDNLGDFMPASPPSDAAVVNEVNRLYAEGVRYVFPVHLVDNAFGGTAINNDTFNYATFVEEGHWWNIQCANAADGITYNFSGAPGFLGAIVAGIGGPPQYPSCPAGQRNASGLTHAGTVAIQQMMRNGMLIDIDHMSQNTASTALTIAESQGTGNSLSVLAGGPYPMNSGHSGLRMCCTGDERSNSSDTYRRIGNIHGMAGIGSSGVDAPSWLSAYINAVNAMSNNGTVPGIVAGFGTDTDGLALGMPPPALAVAAPTGFSSNGQATCPSGYTTFFIVGCVSSAPVVYGPNFQPSATGNQTWNYNSVGVAHYGMLPDFLQDVAFRPGGADIVNNHIMKGAQYFYETWQLAEKFATPPQFSVPPQRCLPNSTIQAPGYCLANWQTAQPSGVNPQCGGAGNPCPGNPNKCTGVMVNNVCCSAAMVKLHQCGPNNSNEKN